MIKNTFVWKTLVCLLSLVIFSYLIIFDYPSYKRDIAPHNVKSIFLSGDDDNIDKEKVSEIESDAELETSTERETQAVETIQIALCMNYSRSNIYDIVYPMLKERGLTGIVVFKYNMLPGDDGRLTAEECKELIQEDWIIALGSTNSLNLSQNSDNSRKALDTYLESYQSSLESRIGTKAQFFYFEKGEYFSDYDEILKKHGLTGLCCYYSQDVNSDNALVKVNGCKVSDNTDLDNIMRNIKQFDKIILSTREISWKVDDINEDITVRKYEEIFEFLAESENIEFVPAKAILQ